MKYDCMTVILLSAHDMFCVEVNCMAKCHAQCTYCAIKVCKKCIGIAKNSSRLSLQARSSTQMHLYCEHVHYLSTHFSQMYIRTQDHSAMYFVHVQMSVTSRCSQKPKHTILLLLSTVSTSAFCVFHRCHKMSCGAALV